VARCRQEGDEGTVLGRLPVSIGALGKIHIVSRGGSGRCGEGGRSVAVKTRSKRGVKAGLQLRQFDRAVSAACVGWSLSFAWLGMFVFV